jgi:hypothetical protein
LPPKNESFELLVVQYTFSWTAAEASDTWRERKWIFIATALQFFLLSFVIDLSVWTCLTGSHTEFNWGNWWYSPLTDHCKIQ